MKVASGLRGLWHNGLRRRMASSAPASRRLAPRLSIGAGMSGLWRFRTLRLGLLYAPTLLAAIYYGLIATDQYESEAQFVVRSAARPEFPGGLSFLVQLGLARSQDDSFVVQQFLTSRDAIERLRAKLPLEAMFYRDGTDFLARYPSILYGPEAEELYLYFQRMVSVVHVDKTGISTLRVRAFRSEDAHAIAATLLSMGEELVNRLNQRLQVDAISNSLAELATAQARLVGAQAALTEFRNRELIVDPAKNAVALAERIARLSADLGTMQAQISETRAGTAASPQLLILQRKARATEEEITRQRGSIADDKEGLAIRIAAYERLVIEREFASRMLASSEAELARARSEAMRQLLYLERVVQPHLSDRSTQPKRLSAIATFFAANVLAALVGWLLYAGVREHAPDRS